MSIDSLDPSIALGFYCHDQKDFENLCDCVQKVSLKKNLLEILNIFFFSNLK